MLYRLLREAVFQLEPEEAHDRTLELLSQVTDNPVGLGAVQAVFSRRYPTLRTEVAGLEFPNPIGLAAGYDKNAEAVEGLFALGFGSVEVGTVTPRPQEGNPKPRLFRYPKHEAVINRMGFNNRGVKALASELAELPRQPGPLGINIGKNKSTPNERAHEDYTYCLQELFPLGDYFVVNVSSPNTPELRDLQTRGYLEDLLGRLQEVNRESSQHHGGPAKPLFVKIAPDLTSAQLDDVVEAAVAAELAGIIATNTTVARGELPAEAREEQGGLSGKPLTDLSRRVIAAVYRRLEGRMPVIGVGGIMDFEAALQHIRAGASLLQLYTGLIYSGPGLPSSLCRKLEQLLQSRALQLVELVGVDAEEYADIA